MAAANRRLRRVVGHVNASPCANGPIAAFPHDFSWVEKAPPDAIFNVAALFTACKDPKKVNLGIGAYRDDDGKPYVLQSVRKAEQAMANDPSLNHEYLGILGSPEFCNATARMLFGPENPILKEGRVASSQTLSGTGALRVAAEAVAEFFPGATVLLSNPTWGNHDAIFDKARIRHIKYRYWDAKGRKLHIAGMLEDLKNARDGSVVLLHACAHNPTGIDPTQDQWREIAAVMKAKKHFPFFDSAYQGYASGNLERDAWAIRYFVEQGFSMFVAQSFAKNFGLYGERTGALHIVAPNKKAAEAVNSQIALLARPNYSNPPAHGARIVTRILTDPALRALWEDELKFMSNRILSMRQALFNELTRLGTPGTWNHIVDQIGMFTYTGLVAPQVKVLIEKWYVFLLDNGRISMAGINSKNVKYLAEAIDDVVRNVKV